MSIEKLAWRLRRLGLFDKWAELAEAKKPRPGFLAAVEAAWRGEQPEIDPDVARCGGKDNARGRIGRYATLPLVPPPEEGWGWQAEEGAAHVAAMVVQLRGSHYRGGTENTPSVGSEVTSRVLQPHV